ncbi:nitroreductase family protein [Cryobacterium sp. CG_9.6]|uniref:nitroreductase family protein n=1 Tax=Cryobacterium sp. CG_9.6 TaxID=2760710 RepID=UPI00247389F6|nr:nitroreductase family protein [Cryobacterium sp. CG_9.6]MDH6237848.1 nitroreductase [Cryobacterium sp. CG_9.6]
MPAVEPTLVTHGDITLPVLDAVHNRRSHSRVTQSAPSHDDLLPLVSAAARAADHASLRPWRLIELRGEARNRLGDACVEAAGLTGEAALKQAAKPLRAALLIAIVACRQPSDKVDEWEQDAAAAGVAHLLTLLLSEAGWGVMWRSGPQTRSAAVRRMHHLADHEQLLGWLYVGAIPADCRPVPRTVVDATTYLSVL